MSIYSSLYNLYLEIQSTNNTAKLLEFKDLPKEALDKVSLFNNKFCSNCFAGVKDTSTCPQCGATFVVEGKKKK